MKMLCRCPLAALAALGAAAGVLFLGGGCSKDDLPPPPSFIQTAGEVGPPLYKDVTLGSGVDFTYRNGEESGFYAILESLGGGVVLIDYDGDGLLDLFVPGGGHYDCTEEEAKKKQGDKEHFEAKILGYPCKLYKNLGNFKFQDVTKEVGLDKIDWSTFYTHGGAVGDYDNDGHPDLLVTGYGKVILLHNVPNGKKGPDGKEGRCFVDVTEEVGLRRGALGKHFWATSAAFADFDGSGFPSLYVCQYVNWSWQNNPKCPGYTPEFKRDVCPPRQYDAVPHALYQNVAGKDGKRRFVDVTKEAGIRYPGVNKDWDEKKEYGKGLGVVVADVNGDGKPDIYVANDTVDNFLYLNHSTPGKLRFEEVGMTVGVARDDKGVPNGSMGTDIGDPFGTGRAAIWCTNYENELHALYRNDERNGRLYYNFATTITGISAIGQLYVGWGTGFVDFDNDGWEDIAITNGHVIRHPAANRAGLQQKPVLFHNVPGKDSNRRFVVCTARGGSYCQSGHRGRGLAIGDLNNDGRPDLVFCNVNEPVAILKNVDPSGNHWLGVRLIAKDHADYVGATLTLEVNGRKVTRFAKGGGSWASANDRRILFGLGQTTLPGRLTVHWPSGSPRVEHWDGLAADQYHKIIQGKGQPQE
jgi:hypothetical protein